MVIWVGVAHEMQSIRVPGVKSSISNVLLWLHESFCLSKLVLVGSGDRIPVGNAGGWTKRKTINAKQGERQF
jgi:hypothetical protein